MDVIAKSSCDRQTRYWSPEASRDIIINGKPVFYVGAQLWVDDRFRFFFPHPATFIDGYAPSEATLFDPLRRQTYAPYIPKIFKPYLCRLNDDGQICSTISVLVMHGNVRCMTMDEARQNPSYYNKSFRPLYEEDSAGRIFVPVSRIVCGEVCKTMTETDPKDIRFIHARTTKVIASNVAVRAVNESFVVISANGDCHYVSPPAQSILSGEKAPLPQLEAV